MFKPLRSRKLSGVALGVGAYDTIIGLWPLVFLDSFSQVTGLWDYLTVARVIGGAWASLGIALLICSRQTKVVPFLGLVSTVAGSSLALAECFLVAAKLIPPVFLIQAACEVLIGITWIRTFSVLIRTEQKEIARERRGLSALSR